MIILKPTYSANNVTAPLRVAVGDEDKNYSYTSEITPDNSTVADGSRFQGSMFNVESMNASFVKIRLTGTPTNSGNVSVFVCAV